MFTHRLHTHIDIDIPPERIWTILADFPDYPVWNPFIRRIRGVPAAGAKLEIHLQPMGGRAMTFRPTVLLAEAGRALSWRGRLLLPGLFDGEHRFFLESLAGGKTRFHQEERFSGILVPLFRVSLERHIRPAFEMMNRALKTRAEAR